jgi:hypothetical protein
MPYPSISKPCVMQVLPSSSPAPPLRWCPTSHPELSRYSHGDALEDHASAVICVKVSATFASKPPSCRCKSSCSKCGRVFSFPECSLVIIIRYVRSPSRSCAPAPVRGRGWLSFGSTRSGSDLDRYPVRRARRSDAGLTLLTSVPSRVEGTNAVAVVESVGGGNPR